MKRLALLTLLGNILYSGAWLDALTYVTDFELDNHYEITMDLLL